MAKGYNKEEFYTTITSRNYNAHRLMHEDPLDGNGSDVIGAEDSLHFLSAFKSKLVWDSSEGLALVEYSFSHLKPPMRVLLR
jgi:hypothetical protein